MQYYFISNTVFGTCQSSKSDHDTVASPTAVTDCRVWCQRPGSNPHDQLSLGVRVALNIALGHGKAGMSGKVLDITERASITASATSPDAVME